MLRIARWVMWLGVCVVATAGAARPAWAQVPKLTLDTSLVFYGDDTEFSNPFRPGQTVLGTYGVAFLDAALSDRLTVRAGGFGNWRFGSSEAIDQGRPVLALVIKDGPSRFIFGTLDTTRHLNGSGPDLTGPHGLLPPMQKETLAFERAYESGVQWTVDANRFTQDAWVNWQRLNTRTRREIFDVGIATRTQIRPEIALRGDFHVVHQGGQQGGVEPVGDSVAVAAGAEVGGAVDRLDRVSLELVGLGSRYVPDREHAQDTQAGLGTFLRVAVVDGPWRVHLILWRAYGFIKIEGDPLYMSIRHDGTRYRGTRDYGELGVSRRFALAKDSFLETSLRFHRTENNYEASVRILGVATLRLPLTK